MRELVPLTNAMAARMIASALAGRGGFDAFLAGARSRCLRRRQLPRKPLR